MTEPTQQTPDQDAVELETPGTEVNVPTTSPDVEIVTGDSPAGDSDDENVVPLEEQSDEENDD